MDQERTCSLPLEQAVTEQNNPLSKNIDVATPKGIASTLYACDQEIFHGWNNSKGIYNESIVDKLKKVAIEMKQVIEDRKNGAIIISGCGTSGRLAFLTTRFFNRYLKLQGLEPNFQYIIAGSDRALFTSQELAEDDPHIGALALQQATEGKTRVVFIGVTCGLSAPFVAGQLNYCLAHLDIYMPVLVGFNPAHLARNISIDNWDKTFLDVTSDLIKAEQCSKGFILNPVIGPEPISGSTRMKSGSATRILLEVLSMAALYNTCSKIMILHLLKLYEEACHSLYAQMTSLAALIQLAGDCLTSSGHIFYLGCNGYGLIGLIDASECPPTYGASFDDIRGFIAGGFARLQNNDGDLSHMSEHHRISIRDFEKDILPSVTSDDLVILLGPDICDEVSLTCLFAAPCRKAYVCFSQSDSLDKLRAHRECLDVTVNICLDTPSLQNLTSGSAQNTMHLLLQEMALKWVLNNVSTGAHILKGKVFHNIMIDVGVSNSKLFHRALGIVQTCSGRDAEESYKCLLKSIYDTDSLTDVQLTAPDVDHIIAATNKNKVVPAAILLASLRCSVQVARDALQKQSAVRKLFCEKSDLE